jgi:hypothetical protein
METPILIAISPSDRNSGRPNHHKCLGSPREWPPQDNQKTSKKTKMKPPIKMKPNRSKCLWPACIAAMAVCMTMSTAHVQGAPANLGTGYVSSVTSTSNCVYSDTNGGGIQFWDIQAGGTYTVTLSGVTDCASQGNESTIGVLVHNSAGGNIYAVAMYQDVGVYQFTITLTSQCLTMPIEYCTHDSNGLPANQPGSGLFAQDNVGGVAGGHEGHLPRRRRQHGVDHRLQVLRQKRKR